MTDWNINPEDLTRIALNKNIAALERSLNTLDQSIIINSDIKTISEVTIRQNNEMLSQLTKYMINIFQLLSKPVPKPEKVSWQFEIQRNDNNLITKIIATPMGG